MKYGVVKNCFIKVGNTDLSNHCIDLSPDFGVGKVGANAFSDNQAYSNPGLTTRGLKATFINDFASGSVFATLNPLKDGAKHVVQYRHDAGTASALNVTYSGLFFITSAPGLIGGKLGSNSEVTVTWEPAGAVAELTT
jgi:hypothetical protein